MCDNCYYTVTTEITKLIARFDHPISVTAAVYRDNVFHNILSDEEYTDAQMVSHMRDLSEIIADVVDSMESAQELFPKKWEASIQVIRDALEAEDEAGKREDVTIRRASATLGGES